MGKKYFYAGLIILSVMFVRSISADEDSKRKLTEELVSVLGVQNLADKMFEQVRLLQISQIENVISSEKDSTGATALQENITELIRKKFEWEAIKNDYIAIYEEAFNEEDIKGLLDFHKSPLGQKLLEKNPEIMEKSMEIGKKRMVGIIPEVQKTIKDWIIERKNVKWEKLGEEKTKK